MAEGVIFFLGFCYEIAGVGKVWWKESMSASEAFAFASELAKRGLKPSVVTMEVSPALISSRMVCRQRIADPVPQLLPSPAAQMV